MPSLPNSPTTKKLFSKAYGSLQKRELTITNRIHSKITLEDNDKYHDSILFHRQEYLSQEFIHSLKNSLQQEREELNTELQCPIGLCFIPRRKAVLLGQTLYYRENLMRWLAQSSTDPLTREQTNSSYIQEILPQDIEKKYSQIEKLDHELYQIELEQKYIHALKNEKSLTIDILNSEKNDTFLNIYHDVIWNPDSFIWTNSKSDTFIPEIQNNFLETKLTTKCLQRENLFLKEQLRTLELLKKSQCFVAHLENQLGSLGNILKNSKPPMTENDFDEETYFYEWQNHEISSVPSWRDEMVPEYSPGSGLVSTEQDKWSFLAGTSLFLCSISCIFFVFIMRIIDETDSAP